MVGYRFMGRVHSHAYRAIPMTFPEVPEPVMSLICGRRENELREAARTLGWQGWTTDWRALVASEDVDVVDVSAPGELHHDASIAALEAGKHVVCEKPLGNNLAEARAMLEAAERSGRVHMTVFNYRYLPAVQLARRLVADGTLGRIYHFRAQFLQDWIADPDFPMVWRLRREQAGSGTLGDLAAHLIDMARFLVGEITSVVGDMETFIRERRSDHGTEEVTVDDAAAFLARIAGGVQGVFEVTRFARGRRCANRFEINGSGGSVAFDFERLNELEVYLADDREDVQGFRTVNVLDPAHPYAGRWWPPGHGIGYETGFVHQLADFLKAADAGEPVAPTFADGYRCQQVLEAVELSARERTWVDVTDVT
jgi:predicted dehydrogenase